MSDDLKQNILQTEEGTYVAKVRICNRRGLHARASAKFVKCAGAYDSEISVTRSGETVGGTSIMGLMMLAAAQNSQITIEAGGVQAKDAIEALVTLVEAGFHEED